MTLLERYINYILEFANDEYLQSVLLVSRDGEEIRQKIYSFIGRKYMRETWLGEYPEYFVHLKSFTDVQCAIIGELGQIDIAEFDAIFFIDDTVGQW